MARAQMDVEFGKNTVRINVSGDEYSLEIFNSNYDPVIGAVETDDVKDMRNLARAVNTLADFAEADRTILDGRILSQGMFPYRNGDERDGMSSDEIQSQLARDVNRDNWLTVLRGEALPRGLDWSKAPTKKVTLGEYVVRRLVETESIKTESGRDAEYVIQAVSRRISTIFDLDGLAEPEIDVLTSNGKPTYQHYVTNMGGVAVKQTDKVVSKTG